MSSHKEAPAISNDAAADNTDVYVFVSPDKPSTVTLIANFVPLEDPAGGPNFYEFGDDVTYEICIDNNGDAVPDVTYRFVFTTHLTDPDTFLYNTGPISSLSDPNWKRAQTYDVIRVVGGVPTTLASGLACPPCNVGPNSTPNYAALATAAIHTIAGGRTVFAGQRAEGFYVDIGAVFDLGDLRPVQQLHIGASMPASGGVNTTAVKNIHSIAIQVPKTDLTLGNVDPTDPTVATSTIGVFARALRATTKTFNPGVPNSTTYAAQSNAGVLVQISRQANPLFNEVLIPIPLKDKFNASAPAADSQFATRVTAPELATLLPVLYPGVFPNLQAHSASRADLAAILLTGIPAGIITGFQNFTGSTQADLLRLNMAIAPATNPSNLGLIGNDLAGFPNGRRVFDDVTTIELRAIAGATIPLVDSTYTPDAAAGTITPGLTSSNSDVTAKNTVHYMAVFPYLGTPHDGFHNPAAGAAIPVTATPQVPVVPVGAPNTGQPPQAGGSDRSLVYAGTAALVGAAAIGTVVAGRHRSAALELERDPGSDVAEMTGTSEANPSSEALADE